MGIDRAQFRRDRRRRATPCVFFDSVVDGHGRGQRHLDNDGGIERLVDHLVEHGHRRIALLAGSQPRAPARRGCDAFRAAMARHGSRSTTGREGLRVGDRATAAEQATASCSPTRSPPRRSSRRASSSRSAACRLPRRAACAIPDDLALVDLRRRVLRRAARALRSRRSPMTRGSVRRPPTARRGDAGRGADRREVSVPVTLVTRRSCGCRQRAQVSRSERAITLRGVSKRYGARSRSRRRTWRSAKASSSACSGRPVAARRRR